VLDDHVGEGCGVEELRPAHRSRIRSNVDRSEQHAGEVGYPVGGPRPAADFDATSPVSHVY
jgi:hypothetical protein